MANGSAAEGFGKVVLGGAVGFALYFLVTGLGFGGAGRGEGRGPGEQPAPPPPVPARPRDDKRLNFLLSSRGFEARDADWKPPVPTKIYSTTEVIARIKEGGRSDVNLKISGGAIQGDVDAALEALKQAGIGVWKTEAAPIVPPQVSGNARGQYGRRSTVDSRAREVRW